MPSDLVVALREATVNWHNLFGLNVHGSQAEWPVLRRFPAQDHPAGEMLRLAGQLMPQARHTAAVLGCGPRQEWGFTHGLNEHNVVLGLASWKSKVPPGEGGLAGMDLVRLTLERSHNACQALDVLTDLLRRHGTGGAAGEATDHVFLLADAHEAMVIETAGRFWAVQECQQVRAVSDVALIRQDWQRLAPGLARFAIEQGWWNEDGSKLDFSGALAEHTTNYAWALKRWGRATLLLEQQNGHIDLWFLRRLLAEHYDTVVSKLASAGAEPVLLTTFLTALSPEPDAVPMAWCAFGLPGRAAYFPVFLDADLPEPLREENVVERCFRALPPTLEAALHSRHQLDLWQARVDQHVEDFLPRARALKRQGNRAELRSQITALLYELFNGFEVPRLTRRTQVACVVEEFAYITE